MIDQKLLKHLVVLYAEDEATIRNSLVPLFTKLFKKVIIAENGAEGVRLFQQSYVEKTPIDVVISDINMPYMNGLEMLAELKKVDPEIKTILTTAHNDSEYLLEAIRLGVSHYSVKPVNVTDLLSNIQILAQSKYNEKIAMAKQVETEQYLSIINKVAIVSKTDTQGIITYVNDVFCEVSGYTSEELLGKPHNMIRHQDMPKEAFKELWDTIQSGKAWKGKVKNRAKDGEPYYVNATIIPLYDEYGDTINGYIAIRFLTTDEENEKREFKKKVIQNIQETKQKEQTYKQQIKILEDKLKLAENIDLIQEFYQKEKEKNARLQNTINSYEAEMMAIRTKSEDALKRAHDEPAKLLADFNQLKVKYEAATAKNKEIEIESKAKESTILKLNTIVAEQAKIIENLRDVIQHLEDKLAIAKIQ